MRYLKEHKTFNNKEELNEATSSHVSRCRYQMNDTDQAVLLMISRYAIKYTGATHLKISTIAETLEKSTRTIQRSLRKLERLQIIEKRSFFRKVKGGFGANIYVILPSNVISEMSYRDDAISSNAPTEEAVQSEKESFIFKATKDKYSSNDDTYASQLSQSFYSRFQTLLKSTIGNTKRASQLYGVYRSQSIKLQRFEIHKDKQELFESLGLEALRITIQATKRKKIKSIAGYYSGVLRELISKVLFNDVFKNYDMDPIELCTH